MEKRLGASSTPLTTPLSSLKGSTVATSDPTQGTGLFPKLQNREATPKARAVDPGERDRCLSEAVAAGKFSAERRAVYAKAWDKNPVSTRRLIETMASGVLPPSGAPQGTGLFPPRDGR